MAMFNCYVSHNQRVNGNRMEHSEVFFYHPQMTYCRNQPLTIQHVEVKMAYWVNHQPYHVTQTLNTLQTWHIILEDFHPPQKQPPVRTIVWADWWSANKSRTIGYGALSCTVTLSQTSHKQCEYNRRQNFGHEKRFARAAGIGKGSAPKQR